MPPGRQFGVRGHFSRYLDLHYLDLGLPRSALASLLVQIQATHVRLLWPGTVVRILPALPQLVPPTPRSTMPAPKHPLPTLSYLLCQPAQASKNSPSLAGSGLRSLANPQIAPCFTAGLQCPGDRAEGLHGLKGAFG